MLRAVHANCARDVQAEMELAGNLSNPYSITIFGSSELGDLVYAPYHFLPDSLHIPTVAFGHAHHQSFAMFCELLAMQRNLKNAKICVLVSPGWFETKGTNIEAFLEFVRPNFLKSILHNDSIPIEYKVEIGKYISSKINDIEQPSQILLSFIKLYQAQDIPFLENIVAKIIEGTKDVRYEVQSAENTLSQAVAVDWLADKKRIQKNFISAITTNSIFVNDKYYTTYLAAKGGEYKPAESPTFDVATNPEFSNFKLLVQVLKRYHCEASFVIQPLNVYHYNHLENYNEIIDSTVSVIQQNGFPCLNMFVTKKQDFEPGTLMDIMHLGDYGWMKVNEFLVKKYSNDIK